MNGFVLFSNALFVILDECAVKVGKVTEWNVLEIVGR